MPTSGRSSTSTSAANPADLFPGSFPWINLQALFAWIDLQLFVPPAFFPSPTDAPNLPDWMGFPFPKGWLIGAAMMVNLLRAYGAVQVAGRRRTAVGRGRRVASAHW